MGNPNLGQIRKKPTSYSSEDSKKGSVCLEKCIIFWVATLFADIGVAASCLKAQQIALVNNVCSILPPNISRDSIPSAICRISSETRSKKRISKRHKL